MLIPCNITPTSHSGKGHAHGRSRRQRGRGTQAGTSEHVCVRARSITFYLIFSHHTPTLIMHTCRTKHCPWPYEMREIRSCGPEPLMRCSSPRSRSPRLSPRLMSPTAILKETAAPLHPMMLGLLREPSRTVNHRNGRTLNSCSSGQAARERRR